MANTQRAATPQPEESRKVAHEQSDVCLKRDSLMMVELVGICIDLCRITTTVLFVEMALQEKGPATEEGIALRERITILAERLLKSGEQRTPHRWGPPEGDR